ncbi:uncharacterized protein LOC129584698 [Paramacrobiotus metropolitanus]|uniref:uncharacterized protein LOC129584698 n=1 Tax=Paramacrobiotus metropolitanus TaxID=2943436 RepID=UPI0024457159|nr:uncharacterized protein LOC129584698 [Paramacrobiotus metropolitanus]
MSQPADPRNAVPARIPLTSRTEYHRINFLLQASAMMEGVTGAQNSSPVSRTTEAKSQHTIGEESSTSKILRNNKALDLPRLNAGRSFLQQAKQVARKAVLRLSADTKRTICRRCWALLVAGSSCSVRFRRGKSRILYMTTTCKACGYSFRLRMKKPPAKVTNSDLNSSEGALPKFIGRPKNSINPDSAWKTGE